MFRKFRLSGSLRAGPPIKARPKALVSFRNTTVGDEDEEMVFACACGPCRRHGNKASMIFAMARRWATHICNLASRATYLVSVCGLIALFLACLCAAKNRPAPVNLFPRLQAGQSLAYQ